MDDDDQFQAIVSALVDSGEARRARQAEERAAKDRERALFDELKALFGAPVARLVREALKRRADPEFERQVAAVGAAIDEALAGGAGEAQELGAVLADAAAPGNAALMNALAMARPPKRPLSMKPAAIRKRNQRERDSERDMSRATPGNVTRDSVTSPSTPIERKDSLSLEGGVGERRDTSRSPRRRKHPMPPDWRPDEAGLTYARERGLDGQELEDAIETHRRIWIGRGDTAADWSPGWLIQVDRLTAGRTQREMPLHGVVAGAGSAPAGAPAEKVRVEKGSPAWKAWVRRNGGRSYPDTDMTIDGRATRGWYFPTEWPPEEQAVA